MSSPNDNNDDAGFLNNTVVLTIIWSVSGVVFLLAPICFQPRRRKIWISRIRERRWDVDVPPERDAEWYRRALERYERARAEERGRAQSPYSEAEEDEIRQIFLLERMANYTKKLEHDDMEEQGVRNEENTVATKQKGADAPDNVEWASSIATSCGEASDERNAGEERATPSAESERTDVEMGSVREGTSADGENDNLASSSDEFDDGALVEEFRNSQNRCILVPEAGKPWSPNDSENNCRLVTNGCAVCLCEYEQGDRVSWASNPECSHVFHEECILNWMLSLGRKKQRRRRNHPDESTGDAFKDVTTFAMICPCCRQDFVHVPENDGQPMAALGGNQAAV